MNERIRELAEQAGYQADMFGVGHWDMPECKKFAELLVRECATLAYDGPNGILEHFGLGVEDTEEDSACPLCGEDGSTTCGMPGCQY